MKSEECIRDRIEELMGWSPGASGIHSLRTLQVFVRGRSASLDEELERHLSGERHFLVKPDEVKEREEQILPGRIWYCQDGYGDTPEALRGFAGSGWYVLRNEDYLDGPYPDYGACYEAMQDYLETRGRGDGLH